MTKIRRIISAAISAVMLSVLLTAFTFADSITEISTREGLLSLSEDGFYRLTADIDLTGYTGSTVIDEFSGVLDGNGKTVSGINLASANGSVGFIGMLSGVVKNLTLSGQITVSGTGRQTAGGFAAVNTGTVDSCKSYININALPSSELYVGGISGMNSQAHTAGTISKCENLGAITLSDTAEPINSFCFIGGISSVFGSIAFCVNTGRINAVCNNVSNMYAAGISAYEATVNHCKNTAEITAHGNTQTFVGGITAFGGATSRIFIQNCINTGSVYAKINPVFSDAENEDIDNTYCAAGGIIGYSANTVLANGEVSEGACTSIIRYCASTGSVSASRSDDSQAKAYAGGIAGIVNGFLTSCTVSDAEISGMLNGQVFAAVNPSGNLRGKVSATYAKQSAASFSPLVGNADTVAEVNVYTDAQMRDTASFPDFDFATAWTINATAGIPVPTIALDHVHTFGEYVKDNNATIDSDGTKTATCTVCGAKDIITDAGTKLTLVNSSEKFSDVPSGKWFKSYVDYAVTYKLFNGTSENTFEPETAMNRAMFVQVLANLDGFDTQTERNSNTVFTDVPSGKWYTGAVKWANTIGIVNGVSETEFAPMQSINRQEMCTMLMRYATYKAITPKKVNAKVEFADDGSISNFAKESVYVCQQAGIVNGMTATEFAPRGIATRGQVAKILAVFHENYMI